LEKFMENENFTQFWFIFAILVDWICKLKLHFLKSKIFEDYFKLIFLKIEFLGKCYHATFSENFYVFIILIWRNRLSFTGKYKLSSSSMINQFINSAFFEEIIQAIVKYS
jgi:hypothetical protein